MSVCKLGCCTSAAERLPRGGWSEDGLTIDPRRAEHNRRVWAATSARIDRMHADYSKCKACGQPALALDAAGLCSKVTESHKTYRVRMGLPPVPAPASRRGARR